MSRRESEDALRQESREGLHVLVTDVQDSLEQMIMLASKLPGNRLSEEAAAALRMQFSNVTIGDYTAGVKTAGRGIAELR